MYIDPKTLSLFDRIRFEFYKFMFVRAKKAFKSLEVKYTTKLLSETMAYELLTDNEPPTTVNLKHEYHKEKLATIVERLSKEAYKEVTPPIDKPLYKRKKVDV